MDEIKSMNDNRTALYIDGRCVPNRPRMGVLSLIKGEPSPIDSMGLRGGNFNLSNPPTSLRQWRVSAMSGFPLPYRRRWERREGQWSLGGPISRLNSFQPKFHRQRMRATKCCGVIARFNKKIVVLFIICLSNSCWFSWYFQFVWKPSGINFNPINNDQNLCSGRFQQQKASFIDKTLKSIKKPFVLKS